MKKLPFVLLVLGLLSLSACMTEMQESQAENNDALLKEIGQSEAYITLTTSMQKAHEIYMQLDRDRYTQIMEEAGVGICDIRQKGIPAGLHKLAGAVEHAELMMKFCEARDQLAANYPGFWDLPPEERVRAMAYRNEAIGFEPGSVLANN